MTITSQSQTAGSHRRSRSLSRAIAAALLFASVTVANAAEYQVELLVFEHLDSRGVQREYWPPPADLPDISAAVSAESTNAITSLPAERLSVHRYWENLRRSQGFRPVLAAGWRQALDADGNAAPVRIHAGPPRPEAAQDGYTPHRVDGVIRLNQGRYMHVKADLIWIDSLAAGEQPRGLQPYRGAAVGLGEPRHWQGFPMRQSRRIREGELHYLDHPRFGILLKVERMENN